MSRAPAATVYAGRYVLRQRRFGVGERSVWLGSRAGDGAPVLVTAGPGPVVDGLDYDVAGVTALLDTGDAPYDLSCLVEARPPGAVATPRLDEVAALAATVAGIAARAQDEGVALGELRPEAVWANGAAVTLAPRATSFWEGGRTDLGMLPGFDTVFLSPERIVGAPPSAEDDVWALAASIASWTTGDHPFAGDSHDALVAAIACGDRRPWKGDLPLAQLVNAALAPAPRRPAMAELAARLHGA